MSAQRDLVVLENGMLAGMAQDDRFRRLLPFLASLGRQQQAGGRRGGCGGCGGDRDGGKQRDLVYNAAKEQIATLDSGTMGKLKALLNTSRIRVHYRTSGGQAAELTF